MEWWRGGGFGKMCLARARQELTKKRGDYFFSLINKFSNGRALTFESHLISIDLFFYFHDFL